MCPNSTLPKRFFVVFTSLIFAVAWSGTLFSSDLNSNFELRSEAEALTQSLVRLNAVHGTAAPATKSQSLQRIIDLTVKRQALLAELMESDPGAVLRTAIPKRVREQMPGQVQAFLERHVELEGELDVIYRDHDDGTHQLSHAIQSSGERIQLHFKSAPLGLLSGQRATVRGVRLNDSMAVASGENDVLLLQLGGGDGDGATTASAAPISNTLGEQRLAVILVNFSSQPQQPWTTAAAHEVVFNTVNAFIEENSTGQTWLSGNVYGWYTLELDPTGCPSTDIATQARQAAEAGGADLSAYDRFVYAFPNISCSWSGEATVGGSPSHAWFDGTLTMAGTVSHELGHNFGLFHSHAEACSGQQALSDGCISVEYGDVLDRMGNSAGGHFNSFQKERLGWLDYGSSPTISTVTVAGNYSLDPYAEQSNGTKALRILRDYDTVSGQPRWYYVESRQAIGFDSYLEGSRYGASAMNGLVFRVATTGDANSSHLLDMTPGSQYYDWDDLALPEGSSFSDPVNGMTFTVQSVNSGGAVVQVGYGQQSCVLSNPAVSVSQAGSQWVEPGSAVSYTVTVSNNDSEACAEELFDLSSDVLSGWVAEFSQPSVSLAPGGSTTTVLTVTSTPATADGIYDINVMVSKRSNSGYSDSATATYSVMADAGAGNEAPVAVDDAIVIPQKEAVTIHVLSNDWDPDGDSIQVTAISQASKGQVVNNGNGTVTYTPGRRFKNQDSFEYHVSDGTDESVATVFISLQASSKGGGKGGGKPKK